MFHRIDSVENFLTRKPPAESDVEQNGHDQSFPGLHKLTKEANYRQNTYLRDLVGLAYNEISFDVSTSLQYLSIQI